jgi:hypothetical protein
MKNSLLRSLAALSAAALLLVGCGGGGGGGGGALPPSYAQYEGICTLEGQKSFVRAYLDEVYLWYNEIPTVDPAQFDNIPDYFNALLVRTPDANGQPKDRFSAVLPTSQAQGILQQSFAQPQSSTATLLKNHTNAVPITNVVTTPGGRRVGYILFNDHATGAQDDLITAFRQIQAAGVADLVLDLRNNSGGFLYIAQTAASMIAGPTSEGQVFEQLRYNDKRQALTAASTLLFSSRVQFGESQYPVGTQLPQLALPRVFVITTGRTCSASESIINSLRGIDVQVIRVGSTTCGKPYGFTQKNNCGFAYFPIEFQGANAKGFGDYTTGFQPMCNIAESGVSAGSSSDPLLNGALFYADNNACPTGTATGVQSAGRPILSNEQPSRPSWAGRLLLPQQQQR